MRVQNDPLFPASGEEKETPLHFPRKCCATILIQYCIIGAHTIQLKELSKGTTIKSSIVKLNSFVHN